MDSYRTQGIQAARNSQLESDDYEILEPREVD